MTREIEIKVKLRWDERRDGVFGLILGSKVVGKVKCDHNEYIAFVRLARPLDGMAIPPTAPFMWNDDWGTFLGHFPTREAAMEAVEAAVIKALGGKITQSGQMDAILQDQNERDRFPRPMGGSHDTSL